MRGTAHAADNENEKFGSSIEIGSALGNAFNQKTRDISLRIASGLGTGTEAGAIFDFGNNRT